MILKPVFIIAIVAVAMIGVMVPSVFAQYVGSEGQTESIPEPEPLTSDEKFEKIIYLLMDKWNSSRYITSPPDLETFEELEYLSPIASDFLNNDGGVLGNPSNIQNPIFVNQQSKYDRQDFCDILNNPHITYDDKKIFYDICQVYLKWYENNYDRWFLEMDESMIVYKKMVNEMNISDETKFMYLSGLNGHLSMLNSNGNVDHELNKLEQSKFFLESYVMDKDLLPILPIASFVDQTKDPQHYIDRYFNEPEYKEWFDENYPQYSSIYEAIGMGESITENIMMPVTIELLDISVTKISARSATIEIAFEISNPNPRTVIVQTIDYQLFETGFSSYEQLAGGTIGSRPEGMVEFGSNYYTLLGENSILLKEKITLANTATGELWDVLESEYDYSESGSASWWVTGTVYFNLSSMTSGQENTVPFEFFLDASTINNDKLLQKQVDAVGLEEPVVEEINEPEYVPEPKTTIVSCSNDVKITPDKDVHQSGETITFTVETFDPCYVDNYRELILYIVGYDRPNCDGCRIIESFLIKTGEPKIFQFYPEILNWSQEYYVRQGTNGQGFGDLLKYDSKGNLVLNENNEIQNLSFIVLPAEQDKKIISVPMCGTGTELVNGICKVIQTEEKSSGGGCLIATATYGSEMAPQVQQLRELRDNQLLQTESGTAFMGTFNDIYYSFSPIIADYERENPLFKEAVKLAITPMISSLSLMENANSESEVLSIGISVIMLNLGMYLGVPAVVIVGIRKRI